LLKHAVLPATAGLLLAVLFVPVVPAAAAAAGTSAGPVEDAAAGLRADSVFLHPSSNRNLDVAALRRAIGDQPIKIAVIPRINSVSEVAVLPRRLARDLPGNTIAVISGRYFYAGSEVVCEGHAGRAAANAVNANEAALDANDSADSPSDITKPLTDFVAEIKAAPQCPTEGGRGDRYADTPGGGEAVAGPDDTASVLPWVLVGLGVGVLAVAALVVLTRRRTRDTAVAHREQATALVRRLGAELDELPAGEGPAAQARVHAAGRHGEADAILIGATTDAQFAAARRVAIEGLIATRSARVALGGDPGPAIPELDPGTERDSGAVPAADSDRR
jgi:hypothetical protein